MHNHKVLLVCGMAGLSVCLLGGCTKRHPSRLKQPDVSSAASVTEDTKSEGILGVVSKVDIEKSRITFRDISNGWVYTVDYDSLTKMESKFGELLDISQLEIGEIIDVRLDASAKYAQSIKVSYDAWEFENVKGLTYNQSENTITIMGKDYLYSSSLVVHDATGAHDEEKEDTKESAQDASVPVSEETKNSADSKDLKSENSVQSTDDKVQEQSSAGETQEDKDQPDGLLLSDIVKQDVVTCRGYKGRICSVTLNSGHGYVRLKDDTFYLGGMIAIGGVIENVSKNMLLTVPVGEWTLEVDKDCKMGTKGIVVNQNEEQTVSLSDLTIVASKKGIFHFEITPPDATITIDGVDYNGRTDFMLEYGKHKVEVSAVDYKSYNGTIDLKSAYMNIAVTLESLKSDEDSKADTSNTSESTTTQGSSSQTTAATSQSAAVSEPETASESAVTTQAATSQIPDSTQAAATTQTN